MLVLRTSNFQGEAMRLIAPRHKHSIAFFFFSPLNFLPRASFKILLNYFQRFEMKDVVVKCKL